MEDLLYMKDLWQPIKTVNGVPVGKPAEMKDVDWEVLNRKCAAQIRQWIDRSIMQSVAKETDAYKLWEKLEKTYAQPSAQNVANLIRRLITLKYKDGSSMSEHINEFEGVADQLSTMNCKFDDNQLATFLLISLPKSWDTLFVSVTNSAPEGKVTLEMVKDRLFNEESRRKENGETFEALVSEKQERRGRSKSRFHQNQQRGRSKSRSRKNFTCHHCGKPGHFKRDCRI